MTLIRQASGESPQARWVLVMFRQFLDRTDSELALHRFATSLTLHQDLLDSQAHIPHARKERGGWQVL